ncbi:MAG: HNH endonuclease [Bacteroidales bacterium]|nr:HNH endonuclease [Bacteroidales bacterium]
MTFDFTTYEGRQSFYQSTIWNKIKRYKKALNPLCEHCLKQGKLSPTVDIHHMIDLEVLPTFENATDISKLVSLCKSCHTKITNQKKAPIWKPFNMKDFNNYFS